MNEGGKTERRQRRIVQRCWVDENLANGMVAQELEKGDFKGWRRVFQMTGKLRNCLFVFPQEDNQPLSLNYLSFHETAYAYFELKP
ncbi:hypothetical protein RUM44_008025 [Polyplax serrata]|uniref:Uncharacterized protein n=1 Tax=Polyplax serrata TaxID=468196 RepID=A0ABR1BC05_POLSC